MKELHEETIRLMRTLIANGFHLDLIKRLHSSSVILHVHKFDSLGARINYSILFTESKPAGTVLSVFLKETNYRMSNPIGIGYFQNSSFKWFNLKEFYQHFGGPVNSGLILISGLPQILERLGYNLLPDKIEGNPDDLLETYVKECLQFILMHQGYRYGHDRCFEPLPDGIVFGKDGLILPFDSKAYRKGYSISADDVKRFASYVETFNKRYGDYIGRVFSFLIVTSKFNQTKVSLEKRSRELHAKCGTPISCIKSKELGEIVELLRDKPRYRKSIDWKTIFSNIIIESSQIKFQIRTLEKDKILI